MAETYAVLGQSAPSAATLTDLYTVPAATSVVSSTLNVCNRSATPTVIRVSVAPGGAANANAQYLAFDVPIGGNAVLTFTIGITLAATDVVRVYNTLATCSFSLFGTEIT